MNSLMKAIKQGKHQIVYGANFKDLEGRFDEYEFLLWGDEENRLLVSFRKKGTPKFFALYDNERLLSGVKKINKKDLVCLVDWISTMEDQIFGEEEDFDDGAGPLTKEGLEEVFSGTKRTVLVAFSSKWCEPCQELKPVLAEVASTTTAQVFVVDIDQNEDLAEEFGVSCVPMVMLFNQGIKRIMVGTRSASAYRKAINSLA